MAQAADARETNRDFVEVFIASDSIMAAMVHQALEAEGIEAFVQGEHHRALLGPLGPYIAPRILVPADQAEEALELISALQDGEFALCDPGAPSALEDEAEEPADEGDEEKGSADMGGVPAVLPAGPYRVGPTPPTPRPRSPRSRVVAALLPLLFPGASCLYTRQLGSALTLWAAALMTTAVFGTIGLGVAIVVVIVTDVILGVRGAGRTEGDQVPAGGSLVGAVVAFVVMFAVAAGLSYHAGLSA